MPALFDPSMLCYSKEVSLFKWVLDTEQTPVKVWNTFITKNVSDLFFKNVVKYFLKS